MQINVEFSETDMTLQADFGELYEKPQKEVYDSGYSDGYEVGEVDGYDKGYKVGETDGYSKGETTGYNNGYTTGKTDGYNEGYGVGESKGYENGYDKGYDVGFDEGKESVSVGDDKAMLDGFIDGSITEIYSEAKSVRQYGFYYATKLTKIDLPSATSVGNYAFQRCTALIAINLPRINALSVYMLGNCLNLQIVDFPSVTQINGYALDGCAKLKHLILRSAKQVNLYSTSAFNSTPIKTGTGYIYVPSALVDSYKSATNWSTYATQFRALEDYTIDGTITGELDPTKTGA